MPRAGAPFQPVRFKGRAAFEKRARSREVATLYNGMFSTDRGLGETEQPFHSFSVFSPLTLVEINVWHETLSTREFHISCVILLSVSISISKSD